ncbi:MAG TPA: sigma-70 family RNA polymerase sigma factor [Solirubrobacterales bacterium]|nr:sigma-70 family RNA polymerase sigma factor [Solirubrobacterales bacterium]
MLKLQGDAKLVAMVRSGNPGAFEAIVDRYEGRLLGFCRQMLGSTEDAEDVLQEVFVNAYKAMLRDEREINLRPWLYRIARNRSLNHLRKPTADAQESMDMVPAVEASSTAEKVHNREEFRQLLVDVKKLPETQRSALLLREMDALSYEEIAAAMETTVPSVKSLLVRARISLAEASQARLLTCGEVRVELSEAAEGLRKVTGPVRRHVRECDECADFRSQVRSNEKALAALFPVGGLLALKGFILSKLGLGSAGGAGSAGAAGAGAAAGGAGAAGAVGGVGAALGGGGAAGGLGAIGGAIGTKAVAGVAAAAVLTAGAVEVKQNVGTPVDPPAAKISQSYEHQPAGPAIAPAQVSEPKVVAAAPEATAPEPAPTVEPAPETLPPVTAPAPATVEEAAGQSKAGEESVTAGDPASEALTGATAPTGAVPPAGAVPGAHSGGGTVVVVTVGSGSTTPPPPPPPPSEPPAEPAPAPAPPVESPPPAGSGDGESAAPEPAA